MRQKLKYYSILGIEPTDDPNVIKKAYRKQALKYHPDKNPSKEAHLKFISITSAYEILTNQQKEDRSGSYYKPKTNEEILAEKIKIAKRRYQQQQEEEVKKDAIYYKKVAFGWKWVLFGVGATYTCLLTILLCFDYFADGEYKTFDHNDHEISHLYLNKVLIIHDEKFNVDMDNFWFNKNGYPPMYGTYSSLFHDLKSVHIISSDLPEMKGTHSDIMRNYELFDKYPQYSSVSHSSVYGVFPILHVVLFIPILLLLFKRPTLRFNIWRLVSIWIIYPLIIFLTFSNDRIYHLIGVFE